MELCDRKREHGRRKRRSEEPMLEFCYCADRPELPAVCRLLEEWYSCYPPEEQKRLLSRLSSRNDDDVFSAFFELYLFTLLHRLQFNPIVPQTQACGQKIEDFRAFRRDEIAFHLEAKYTGQEEAHARQDNFQRQLQHSLDKAGAEGVWVSVGIDGDFDSQPAVAKVRRKFDQWYIHNRDTIATALAAEQPGDSLPKFETEEAGATITITPWLLKPEKASSTGPVGVWSGDARWMQTDKQLRRALKRKGSRYGKMDVPFVVAVSLHEVPDKMDIENALFGDEVTTITMNRGRPVGSATCSRKRNGFWHGPTGPKNTRVSAVLLVSELLPWSVARRQPTIYHNPWAKHPLSAETLPFAQAVWDRDNRRYTMRDGHPVHEILGLSRDWPSRPGD